MSQPKRGYWGGLHGVKLPDGFNSKLAVHKTVNYIYDVNGDDYDVGPDDAEGTYFILNAPGAGFGGGVSAVNMVFPAPAYGGKFMAVKNSTGMPVTVKCSGGSGFTIAANKTYQVFTTDPISGNAIALTSVV